jgi:hypothetical protein
MGSMACSPLGMIPAASSCSQGSMPIFEQSTASQPARVRMVLASAVSASPQVSPPLQ